RSVADRHGTDIATVSSAWTLAQPQVAAVIVGARNRAHLGSNLAITDIALGDADRAEIEAARAALTPLDGDVYALERDRTSRHGAVMKYNLNRAA
ncbi:MAG: aldo/keto reductase, partial [Pseudomonadota bacterium]